ncbi:hypothetical protein D3C85_14310 [compost metagenome]
MDVSKPPVCNVLPFRKQVVLTTLSDITTTDGIIASNTTGLLNVLAVEVINSEDVMAEISGNKVNLLAILETTASTCKGIDDSVRDAVVNLIDALKGARSL